VAVVWTGLVFHEKVMGATPPNVVTVDDPLFIPEQGGVLLLIHTARFDGVLLAAGSERVTVFVFVHPLLSFTV
jgi:hypothetical protein